jgi:hypothetical protein
MSKLVAQLLLAAAIVGSGAVSAKVADAPPIVDGDIIYRSHANYVEAARMGGKDVLWKTELYPSVVPERPDPGVEQDVQWNIIQTLNIQGDLLRATDRQGRTSSWISKPERSCPSP